MLAFFVPRPPGVETGPPLPGELLADLVVPLVHKDRVIGVLDLESPQLDRFNERHVNRSGTGRAERLDVSGLPLGTFDGASYDELKVDLSVIEARKDREDYGRSGCAGAGAERLLVGDRDRRTSHRRPGGLPR